MPPSLEVILRGGYVSGSPGSAHTVSRSDMMDFRRCEGYKNNNSRRRRRLMYLNVSGESRRRLQPRVDG